MDSEKILFLINEINFAESSDLSIKYFNWWMVKDSSLVIQKPGVCAKMCVLSYENTSIFIFVYAKPGWWDKSENIVSINQSHYSLCVSNPNT